MELHVPADLEARVGALIGVPFLAHGDDPRGWDCRGCLNHCYATLLNHPLPNYRALYDATVMGARRAQDRARLIAEQATAWRPVEPQAGAAAWLEWLGSAGHVGFMIGPRRLIHADVSIGTALLDLDRPPVQYRLRGAFVPAAVTRIVHDGGAHG